MIRLFDLSYARLARRYLQRSGPGLITVEDELASQNQQPHTERKSQWTARDASAENSSADGAGDGGRGMMRDVRTEDARGNARAALTHLEPNLGHDHPLTRQARELLDGGHGQ